MGAIAQAMERSGTPRETSSGPWSAGATRWPGEDNRKHITYTTPGGRKCRDIRLHQEKISKGSTLEYEFKIRAELLRQLLEALVEKNTQTVTEMELKPYAPHGVRHPGHQFGRLCWSF